MTSIRCYYCGGHTLPAVVTDLFSEAGVYVAVENVPADVCQQCGERYYAPDVTDRLLQLTAEARQCATPGSRAQVTVHDFQTTGNRSAPAPV
jgi:YgiT-type zinc finger domain-containing protein